ncbi:MAG TPA: hypothetical protein VJM11_04915 [Nevskiaceae bacterium]|nr:hypothetical protein [Nevskiaceae bacterium]
MSARRIAGVLLLVAGLARAAGAPATDEGTTVVGERETALGLVLTPWPDEGPAALDRPPSLLDEAPAPVDADAYGRAVRIERDLAGWRRARVEPSR